MQLPRLYPILDVATLERPGFPLVEAADAILDGGAQVLQLRAKGHLSRRLFDEAGRIAALCRQAGALFIMNDRADLALLLDAGLHVGQEDLSPPDARRLIGPERMLGLSTHNEAQLRAAAAEPVDYLALGPIFTTGTKKDPDPVVGLDGLRRWRSLADRPLVAIGGITRARAREVLAAGADSLAVVGDLYPEDLNRQSLRARIEEWLKLLNPPPRGS